MFRFLIIILSLSFLFSCKEEFNIIDATNFNNKIKDSVISSPTDLIKAFYKTSAYDNVKIETKNLIDNQFEITLIHSNLEDDSVSDLKIIMLAENKHGKWEVLEIKESWKCHSGRGRLDCGSSPCI